MGSSEEGPHLASEDPFVGAETSWLSLLDRGSDGFLSRLALVETAEHSLDLQYYLWWEDVAGLILLRRVQAAADRGVKVRLLLDDFLYKAPDEHVAALGSHPNIEIKLYNPAGVGRGRKLARSFNFLFNFRKLDHRMHNKMLIADGRRAVMGGRNIGDDYFGTSEEFNFRDMGVLVRGHAVEGAAESFLAYWESKFARPIEDRYKKALPDNALGELAADFAAITDAARTGNGFSLADSLSAREARMILKKYESAAVEARVVLVADLPGKVGAFSHESVVLPALLRLEHHARKDILLVTPYFVPYDFEIEDIEKFVSRGGRIRILTNSLVSNNQPMVHAGYSSRRRRVLEAGAELHEVRTDAARKEEFTSPPAHEGSIYGLHCKAALFDDDRAFLGTFNLDPRSAAVNTEVALLIESKELNRRMRATLEKDLELKNSWQVTMKGSRGLRWAGEDGGQRRVLSKEPDASLLQRLKIALFRMLPVAREL